LVFRASEAVNLWQGAYTIDQRFTAWGSDKVTIPLGGARRRTDGEVGDGTMTEEGRRHGMLPGLASCMLCDLDRELLKATVSGCRTSSEAVQ
jgi:hypothetical protein